MLDRRQLSVLHRRRHIWIATQVKCRIKEGTRVSIVFFPWVLRVMVSSLACAKYFGIRPTQNGIFSDDADGRRNRCAIALTAYCQVLVAKWPSLRL